MSGGLTNPAEFFKRHKCSAHYIFWRFVAGLLDATGDAIPFVDLIEAEPLDMLVRTHQRLVMHCLGQILSNSSFKKIIELRQSD